MTYLNLDGNDFTSVPSELAALTGLAYLYLDYNQLTGVPTEFRTWGPSGACYSGRNPGFMSASWAFSCANVGAGTSCCTGQLDTYNRNNNCGEGLPGGPCYTG